MTEHHVVDPEVRLHELATKTKRFDSVTSAMLATMSITGVVAAFLLISFITDQLSKIKKEEQPFEIVNIQDVSNREPGLEGGGDGDYIEGDASGSANQMPDLPGMLAPDMEMQTSEASEIITEAIDAIAAPQMSAEFTPQMQDPTVGPKRGSGGRGMGYGPGKGGSGGGGILPETQRWTVIYSGGNLTNYKKQLDFFKISLGVVQGKNVQILSNFTAGRPTVTQIQVDPNQLYFIWQDEERKRADREIVREAGIAVGPTTVIAQFFPPAVENHLKAIEMQYAKNRKLQEIRHTRFEIRKPPRGEGYEFYVKDQKYFD